MITTLMILYLQCVSIVGLLEFEPDRIHGSQVVTLQDLITQQGLIPGVYYSDDLLYRTATGTTTEVKYPEYFFKNQQPIGTITPYFDMEQGISAIEWYKNPYFQCPKCKSGQVQATMTPLGCSKEFVFDCHCEACEGKWQVKIPVIVEVIE